MADVITGTYVPGFRLIDGSALNTQNDQVNAALAGTTAIVINATGNFNGTIGGTTPGAVTATYVRESVADALTAAGSSRTDALQLAAQMNVVATATSGTGVLLPSATAVGAGGSVIVFNDGANPIKVYATGSETIDGTAGATGVTLTNALRCEFYLTTTLKWKSAKLGATST